jgi:hypothetical protein
MLTTTNSGILATPPAYQIHGRRLAFSKKPPRVRAKLAADIVAGRVAIVDLTVGQAAQLCRVRRASVSDARKPPSETLKKTWAAASTEQRRQFILAVGSEEIWHVLAQAL